MSQTSSAGPKRMTPGYEIPLRDRHSLREGGSMDSLTKPAYLLEHDWEQEPRRLRLLEEHADPTSVRRLEATGVGPGWTCLEVGAGRGSIARWLGGRVGGSGHVVALDLDTSLLTDLDEPNIEVLEGDILDAELPAGSFDLIHARLVLMHIPQRR